MLNRIGFFQFDNLVKNRIPFLFLNMTNDDVSANYTSIYKMHMENNQKMVQADSVSKELNTPGVSKDTAIVLMCADGSNSPAIAANLEKNGYTNVYVIDGGYQQLMTERSQA